MESKGIEDLVKLQKEYFHSGETLNIKFRINQLKLLHKIIKKYEKEISNALLLDLGKSEYESYMCEVVLA